MAVEHAIRRWKVFRLLLRVRFPGMYDDLAGLRQELQPNLVPTGTNEVKRLP